MNILFKNSSIFPEQENEQTTGLYTYYQHSGDVKDKNEGVFWFDFHTTCAHSLQVEYHDCFYKMVVCVSGNSRSKPRFSGEYGFDSGRTLFYHVKPDSYRAELTGNTDFKVIHIHFSSGWLYRLQTDIPELFESPDNHTAFSTCSIHDFNRLKSFSDGQQGLKNLYEEKLITDQLFSLAERILKGREKLTSTKSLDILMEAKWYIETSEHFLTIAELAKRTGTNTFTLKQIFREKLNGSVFQYQADLKLQKAHELITGSDADIQEIATFCGYESPGSFSNAFFKKYGYRPSALRKFPNE